MNFPRLRIGDVVDLEVTIPFFEDLKTQYILSSLTWHRLLCWDFANY
jgi:hypothetical protein